MKTNNLIMKMSLTLICGLLLCGTMFAQIESGPINSLEEMEILKKKVQKLHGRSLLTPATADLWTPGPCPDTRYSLKITITPCANNKFTIFYQFFTCEERISIDSTGNETVEHNITSQSYKYVFTCGGNLSYTNNNKQIYNSEELPSNTVKLFPNPITNQEGTIVYNLNRVRKNIQLEIRDLTGRVVYVQNNLPAAEGNNNYTFNVGEMNSGHYTCTLRDNDGLFIVNKLLISK